MEYISIQEMALNWNMSKRRIQILCKEGRISEAKRVGNMWLLPQNAVKPFDARTKIPVHQENTKVNMLSVRMDLKRLLKIMYKKADEIGIEWEFQRSYVLSALSASIISSYITDYRQDLNTLLKYYQLVFSDIEDKRKFNTKGIVLLDDAMQFVYSHENELDDIISWAYQYSNKLQTKSLYAKTQFFTEKYMIDFLLSNIEDLNHAKKIVDPCCGGGNFLVMCYEQRCKDIEVDNYTEFLLNEARVLHGYDIDSAITKIAVVNIRIKALSLLKKHNEQIKIELWSKIKPNIFASVDENMFGTLALGKQKESVINILTNKITDIELAIGEADIVVTNPPFETVKGMKDEMKNFLKKYYENANSDMCVSFLMVIKSILKKNGICGVVTQNAWMFLKSFDNFRKELLNLYDIKWIANLGSGAFYDLSGEKSNVALMIFSNGYLKGSGKFKYLDLCKFNINQKKEKLFDDQKLIRYYKQDDFRNTDAGFDFTSTEGLKTLFDISEKISSVATPMQGTSTGNAKELIDYFWKHFNETEWKLVSKGGGYSRWQGLNNYVVKWGTDGEYIKNTQGSALRNVKHFTETSMVFSDTGTAGLNVRNVLDDQIFIASGPGIRVKTGNEYAQLAFLNSRMATFYIRILSPKLTIAAGYIGKLPITQEIYNSIVLENNAKLCIEQKLKFLSIRPINYEFNSDYLIKLEGELKNCAWKLFLNDIKNEVLKLEIESQIDIYICNAFNLTADDKKQLEDNVGKCAYDIEEKGQVDCKKLDIYLGKHLDDCCMLKRSKTSKMAIGNDGIVEYASKEFNVNPEHLVKEIIKRPMDFEQVIRKYTKLILHNEILCLMKYQTINGLGVNKIEINKVMYNLQKKYQVNFDIKQWILDEFEALHKSIFKGSPILKIEGNNIIESR